MKRRGVIRVAYGDELTKLDPFEAVEVIYKDPKSGGGLQALQRVLGSGRSLLSYVKDYPGLAKASLVHAAILRLGHRLAPNELANVVSLLVKHEGGLLNARAENGLTPLHLAAMRGYGEVVDVLLRAGANPNVLDRSPHYGRPPLFYALNLRSMTDAAHAAVVERLLPVTDLSIIVIPETSASGAGVASPVPLSSVVAKSEYRHLMRKQPLKVEREERETDKGLAPVGELGRRTMTRPQRGVFDDEADPRGYTELHDAVFNDDLREVRRLLSEGADANATDKDGQTPLYHALSARVDKEIISLLLDRTDLNRPTSNRNREPLRDTAINIHHGRYVGLLKPQHLALPKAEYDKGKKMKRVPPAGAVGDAATYV